MRYHITRSELEILRVLWDADSGLSRSEILERSDEKTWKDSSIHILLNGLLKKGLIKESGFVRSGKVWGRLYAPDVSAMDYYKDMFDSGPRPKLEELLTYLLSRGDIQEETISRMQKTLSCYKERFSDTAEQEE